MSSNEIELDWQMRQAAFMLVKRRAEIRQQLTSDDLKLGFQFGGERYPLVNPQRGIFKTQSMKYALSIRTVFPRNATRWSTTPSWATTPRRPRIAGCVRR